METQQDFKLSGTNRIPAKAATGIVGRLKRFLQVRLAKWLFQDEPMIWTKLGNMPEAALEHRVEWGVNDQAVACVLVHTYQGEEVKRSPNIFILPPKPINATQGQLG